jgi:hypothetical protein
VSFPVWARYRTAKGALKLHHILDVKSDMPVFMVMTEAKKHDIAAIRGLELPVSSDSILVFDRGYMDFEWFKLLDGKGIIFVTRAKKNLDYQVVEPHSLPVICPHYLYIHNLVLRFTLHFSLRS